MQQVLPTRGMEKTLTIRFLSLKGVVMQRLINELYLALSIALLLGMLMGALSHKLLNASEERSECQRTMESH